MPQGTRRALRQYISRRRRAKNWGRQQRWFEQPEKGRTCANRELNPVVKETRTLLAIKEGSEVLAIYERRQKGWRLGSHHSSLHFLQSCGLENAAAALRNRGFEWRWI